MRTRAHWVGLAVGGGVLAFGIAGFVRDSAQTVPANSLQFIAGSLLAHDALWAWGVAAVGALLVRTVPPRVRPVVIGALATSAVLVLIALPALVGDGRLANNPSILPRHYGRGLVQTIAVVWLFAAVLAVRAMRRRPTP